MLSYKIILCDVSDIAQNKFYQYGCYRDAIGVWPLYDFSAVAGVVPFFISLESVVTVEAFLPSCRNSFFAHIPKGHKRAWL